MGGNLTSSMKRPGRIQLWLGIAFTMIQLNVPDFAKWLTGSLQLMSPLFVAVESAFGLIAIALMLTGWRLARAENGDLSRGEKFLGVTCLVCSVVVLVGNPIFMLVMRAKIAGLNLELSRWRYSVPSR